MRIARVEFKGEATTPAHIYVRALVKHHGGIRPVAEACRVSFQSVWRWVNLKSTPQKQVIPTICRLYEEIKFSQTQSQTQGRV